MDEHSNEWISWHWHPWQVHHYVTCTYIFYKSLMFNLHWFDENQTTNQYPSICHPNRLLNPSTLKPWKMKKKIGILKYSFFWVTLKFSMGVWFYISLHIFGTMRFFKKITHFLIAWNILMTCKKEMKGWKKNYSKWIFEN